MKLNKTFFTIAILLVIAFIFAGCGIIPTPAQPKGTVSGRVLIPPDASSLSRDITGWVPAANATVTLVDTNRVTHTVTTDGNGYYAFENIEVNRNTVITASVTVNGKTIVLKDVIPQAVAEDEDYDAGTMTPESTALALVVEKLIAEGVDPADIALAEIQASDSFAYLVELVTTVIEEEGDVTDDPDVTVLAGNIADEIINPPAPPSPPTVVPVTSVNIDQEDQTLTIGATIDLSITIEPANATYKSVSWVSDNEAVATVSAEGTVTAVVEGTATIAVTTEDGSKTDSISINVSKIYNQTSKTSHNTIMEAIVEATAGDTILVGAGEFVEDGQIVIDKDLSIIGADKETTIIKPNQSTGSAGDERGWVLVKGNVEFNLSNVTLDGKNKQIYQAIRSLGTGTIDNNIINNMKYSQHIGLGVVFMGTADNFVVSNNTFTNIWRIGIMAYGEGISGGEISGNTYTGKGSGDFVDYGVEIGGGATNIEITGNTITNCGPSPTGWSSAGISITSFYAASKGSNANVTNNFIENNEVGIILGYPGETYKSTATVTGNTFRYGVAMNVDATGSLTFNNNEVESQVSGLSIAETVPAEVDMLIMGNTFKDTYLDPGERYFTDRRYDAEGDTRPVPYIDDVIADNTFDNFEKYWDAGRVAWLIRVPE